MAVGDVIAKTGRTMAAFMEPGAEWLSPSVPRFPGEPILSDRYSEGGDEDEMDLEDDEELEDDDLEDDDLEEDEDADEADEDLDEFDEDFDDEDDLEEEEEEEEEDEV